jgi:hypothetical protein
VIGTDLHFNFGMGGILTEKQAIQHFLLLGWLRVHYSINKNSYNISDI